MAAKNFKETKVYKLAYEQAMEIFRVSKGFPSEEKYSLTDQIRKASRSVCATIAAAYQKKLFPAHFVLKITDSDAENSATDIWPVSSKECNYIPAELYYQFIDQHEETGRLLHHLINHPDKF